MTLRSTISHVLVTTLRELGVRQAYGIIGGAIAHFCNALRLNGIEIVHARHESGAAFMAAEASLATGQPVVVFSTTGPGVTNLLTGLVGAATEHARIVCITPATEAGKRGRIAFQETLPGAIDLRPWVHRSSADLHNATIEKAEDLIPLAERLAELMAQPGGFVVQVSLTATAQTAAARPLPLLPIVPVVYPPREADVQETARRIAGKRLVIWAGLGAASAAPSLRALAERTGAAVMTSPRAKGVFPEDHPQSFGVAGLFGAQPRTPNAFVTQRPDVMLAVGTRLSESTSCFDGRLVPREALIHINRNSSSFGHAFPDTETICFLSEVDAFLEKLLERLPPKPPSLTWSPTPRPVQLAPRSGRIRPPFLMEAIQRQVVDKTEAVVFADPGNSFAWTNLLLCMRQPKRYRVAPDFGAMTQANCGVVGAALAYRTKAVAVVGDGAMLMVSELSTAVAHGAPAVWIVLNDAQYGMIYHGMKAIGMDPFSTAIPRVDFTAYARALGADGVTVETEHALDAALDMAMEARGPFVLDVLVDPEIAPPFGNRNESLIEEVKR